MLGLEGRETGVKGTGANTAGTVDIWLWDPLGVVDVQMLIFILVGADVGSRFLTQETSACSSWEQVLAPYRLPAVLSHRLSSGISSLHRQVHFPQDEQSSSLLLGPGLTHGKPTLLSIKPQLSPKAADHILT